MLRNRQEDKYTVFLEDVINCLYGNEFFNIEQQNQNVGVTENCFNTHYIPISQQHSPNADSQIDEATNIGSSFRQSNLGQQQTAFVTQPSSSFAPSDNSDSQKLQPFASVSVETCKSTARTLTQPSLSSDVEPQPSTSTELQQKSFRQTCKCTKSHCLQVYCACFGNQQFCEHCDCINCHNNIENETLRSATIKSILDRKPNTFKPKIDKSEGIHKNGCNCKHSKCNSNYCECFNANIHCSSECKCENCRNGFSRYLENVIPSKRVKRKMRIAEFLTDDVRSAVTECLLRKLAENVHKTESEQQIQIMEEFSRCFAEVRDAVWQANKK